LESISAYSAAFAPGFAPEFLKAESKEDGSSMPDGKGGKVPVVAKYVVVFRRQPDGSIKAIADISNANA
jgi:hypothetical protein